jgi:hypothetical protein
MSIDRGNKSLVIIARLPLSLALIMRSFWSESFLWIHLAGLAVCPLFLQIVWIALAVGDPIGWAWLEITLVAAIGILPILWMQLGRPLAIFSLLWVAIKPQETSEVQRKILSLFLRQRQKLIAWLGGVIMFGLMVLLYQTAPVASIVPVANSWRLLALLIATVAFALANLFLQVPLSILGVLWTKEEQFMATEPLEVDTIVSSFTILGFRFKKILPPLTLTSN